MKLSNYPTKPSLRTKISFTESEVIKALRCHAEKNGFIFKIGTKLAVEESQRYSPRPEPTKLVADVEGNEPAITKESE